LIRYFSGGWIVLGMVMRHQILPDEVSSCAGQEIFRHRMPRSSDAPEVLSLLKAIGTC